MGKRKKSSTEKPTADAAETNAGSPKDAAPKEPQTKSGRPDGFRETVESVVIAFVLAFLFRTFEAEAFVIPTGSMAETLYGRHKDVDCEKCHTLFRVSASSEINDNGYIILDSNGQTPDIINYALCPNCRYPSNVLDNLAFVGDRILVNKFPYEFGEPTRFDVVVFKYPEEPKTNYIKRLIGLPGETIKIEWGDLYARKSDTEEWQILREPPVKQKDLQVPVYDNDKPARELLESGWPERWSAVNEVDQKWQVTQNDWSADTEKRQYRFNSAEGSKDQLQWLRYRHIIPYVKDWQRVLRGEPPEDPLPQLVTDFSSYNSGISLRDTERIMPEGDLFPEPVSTEVWGVHWVGDLTLSCDVEIIKAQGELLLELVEGDRWYRCHVDLATGTARLESVDTNFDETPKPLAGTTEAATPLKEAGTYEIQFGNNDDRLLLWIDGDLIDFGPGGGDYSGPRNNRGPTWRDLAPVGIAARDTEVEVSHLKITRDFFYLSGNSQSQTDFEPPDEIESLKKFLSDPNYARDGYRHFKGYGDMQPNTFELGEDEFFVLGDNSARSKDSRLWTEGRVESDYRAPREVEHLHAVPRDLLIGKAFFIYWPHGIPFLNDGRGIPIWYYKQAEFQRGPNGQFRTLENSDHPSLTVPFYPQYKRWKRIR